MQLAPSPLAKPFSQMSALPGVTVRVARAGYKDWERPDLTLVQLPEGTSVAGVFTKSACASYEVELGRDQLQGGTARALVVNAGNANAFTGQAGRDAVQMIAAQVADAIPCAVSQVFVSSTGVIGVPLPRDKAQAGLAQALAAEPVGWEAAARAIGTTDTFCKGAAASAMLTQTHVELLGIVKGSGMIAPDMATMLGYVFTDASISPSFLQDMLNKANSSTFACITVDGDTSTSDTLLLFATGTAGNATMTGWDSPGADAFYGALHSTCGDLAQLVVRDGEGATKFIEVAVTGAVSDESARKVGLSIANSPLVKTAIAGEDANWGRIVMAVGKAGEPADRDSLTIAIGGIELARNGAAVPDYDEDPVAEHLRGSKIVLTVDLGIGQGQATVWTCDLTHGYIAINADYRS